MYLGRAAAEAVGERLHGRVVQRLQPKGRAVGGLEGAHEDRVGLGDLTAGRAGVGPQLGQGREGRHGAPAPHTRGLLEPEGVVLYERKEDCVVELDEVAALLPVLADGGDAGHFSGRGGRVIGGRAVGLRAPALRLLAAEQHGAVDVTGGLGLAAVVLHDVREVLLEGLPGHLGKQKGSGGSGGLELLTLQTT